MNVVLFVLGNLVVIVVLIVYVNKRIDKRLRPEQIISQMRSEIEGIITELNQTTERNIALIEDRVHRLQSLMDAADRRITVLKREAEREDRTKAVYTNLGRMAAAQRAQAPASQDLSEAGKGTGAEEVKSGKAHGRTQSTPVGEQGVSDSRRRGVHEAEGGDASRADRTASEIAGNGSRERSAGEGTVGQQPGDSRQTHGNTQETAEGNATYPVSSKRNQILELHRKGIAANIIANRVGSTIGEVELVISLDSR